MDRFKLLFSFALLLPVVASVELRGHSVGLKSFRQTELECRQYLQLSGNSNPDCLRRCQLLVLRSWNDSSGLLGLPFSKHFQPDRNDQDYLNRSRKCIVEAEGTVSVEDVCRQASISWQCYVDQFGTLLETPQFVPAPDLLLKNVLLQCALMLQVEPQELEIYIRSGYNISVKSRCLRRCVHTRLGLWSDAHGPNVGRLFVQCGGYGLDEQMISVQVHQCVDNLRRSKCYDNCSLLSRVFSECFPKNVTLGYGLLQEAVGIVGTVLQDDDVVAILVGDILPALGPVTTAAVQVVQAAAVAVQGTIGTVGAAAANILSHLP